MSEQLELNFFEQSVINYNSNFGTIICDVGLADRIKGRQE